MQIAFRIAIYLGCILLYPNLIFSQGAPPPPPPGSQIQPSTPSANPTEDFQARFVLDPEKAEQTRLAAQALRSTFRRVDLISPYLIRAKEGRSFQLFGSDGNRVIPGAYDEIRRMGGYGNFVIVRQNRKFQVLDMNGNEVLPFGLRAAEILGGGGDLLVHENRGWMLYDKDLNQLFETFYNDVTYDSRSQRLFVEQDGLTGITDLRGNVVLSRSLKQIDRCQNGYCTAKDINNKFGVISSTGELIIPFEYDFIGENRNGNSKATKDGKYGYISVSTGEVLVDFIYQNLDLYDFSFPVVPYKREDLYGLISTKGEEILEPTYTSIYTSPDKNNQVFVVRGKERKYGLIDADGNLVVPIEYDEILTTIYSSYRAKKEGKLGVFAIADGAVIIPFEYDDIQGPINDLYIVKKGESSGVISADGIKIIPVGKYVGEMEIKEEGMILLTNDDKQGLLNSRGEQVVPTEYRYISIQRRNIDGEIKIIAMAKKEDLSVEEFEIE